MYTALAPIPLSTFAGEPSQNVGKSFIKSYCAVCLEGAVIVLFCIIFSVFASSPPVVNPDAAAVTADFCKQLFLPRLGVGFMDECDLLAGDSSGDELFPDVVKSPACRTACSPSSAARHHLRVVDEILIDGKAVRVLSRVSPDTRVYPIGFDLNGSVPLLEKDNIRNDIRTGVGAERIVGQAVRAARTHLLQRLGVG